ncbi:MAG: excinuclease ABC subunit UvrC [Coriobacteriales bacterium]|jgi:excinuclease ABC subunit C|nr:excinuclease ABC subunit UvrC [Coriobacteriales bacterium]
MSETHLAKIKEELKKVPQAPGCYLWQDGEGSVLYVGKAKRLRARMSQYVNFSDERAMLPLLMQEVRRFEYVVVSSEHESLVLEKNLINQYHPPFNVDFKDDKSYPYIALTKFAEFPAIKYTREKPRAGTEYFGPYTDAHAARKLIDIIRKLVPVCKTSCVEYKRFLRESEKPVTRPCFDYSVGKGPGVCAGAITAADYAENIRQVEDFLHGDRAGLARRLKVQIAEASANLEFERAKRLAERLEIVQDIDSKQSVSRTNSLNCDVIGIYREETIAAAHVLSVRHGNVLLTNEFILNKGLDITYEDLLSGFILRYYDGVTDFPHELVVEHELPDGDDICAWLTTKLASPHGAQVRLTVPGRGQRYQLLALANKNARHSLLRYKVRSNYDDKRGNQALLELESALAMEKPPLRIECYDVSTLHGHFNVASMVVFEGGAKASGQYRRFKIKGEYDEANDVAMMAEVMERRFAPQRRSDARFATRLPDLLIVDGGKPQLNATLRQLSELGVEGIAVAGLAKSDEELFVDWQSDPVVLPSGSASLYLVKQIRDEAHRFAITFHRELRGKAQNKSILSEINGLGPKRSRALLNKFGSIRQIKAASEEQLAETKGVNLALARDIYDSLRVFTDNTEDD